MAMFALGALQLAARSRGNTRRGKRPFIGKRRRRGLTAKAKSDLIWLKSHVGKTAAANYLAKHNI